MTKRPFPAWRSRPRDDSSALAGGWPWVLPWGIALLLGWPLAPAIARGAEEPAANAFELADDPDPQSGGDAPADEGIEPAVLLPSDRGRERSLDRAERLCQEGRWSDAVSLLDDLLAEEGDAFVEQADAATPRESIRGVAERVVATLPRAGREAYLLLVRARADRKLATAIAAADSEAILGVARRWFHTPAGHQAALLTGVEALEAGEPLAATAWLDRLAAADAEAFEPSLSFMRALARHRAGDTATAVRLLEESGRRFGGIARIAGQDESLSAAAARPREWLAAHDEQEKETLPVWSDWRQLGRLPCRNATHAASRPLLVPRYRVPLVRHPAEAQRLERQRRKAADAGLGLVPAAAPLAVGDQILTRTPLGILAIDFDSGRRLWLGSSVPTAAPERSEFEDVPRVSEEEQQDRMFDDATSGLLASDGQLVFAVESPPEALAAGLTIAGFGGQQLFRGAADWHAGNHLVAYDLTARGEVRWRLPPQPAADDEARAGLPDGWYLGGPLVVGDELYVMVERRGEVSLDVLVARDGSLRWSQPLATYEDEESITSPAARGRRLAGLTPAFADGIVVCPVGGGSIVAVNTATRSLAWASEYPRRPSAGEPAGSDPRAASIQRSDPCPLIAAGSVIVAAADAEMVLCLDLRSGARRWSLPARGRFRLTGVAGGRVIAALDRGIAAFELDTGREAWLWPFPPETHASGRGILTGETLLQPLDSPEVVEIDIADGSLRGRSPARGGVIPGHLVPHRGEIISQGIDSLDVFHQEDVLDRRIETASAAEPAAPWALYWRAQTAIERGDVAAGLDGLTRVIESTRLPIPPGGLPQAIERAIERDFAAVRARWPMLASATPAAVATPTVSRMMVDACLEAGDLEAAWLACAALLDAPRGPAEPPLIQDGTDPSLALTADRWLTSRVSRMKEIAAPDLATEIEAALARVGPRSVRDQPARLEPAVPRTSSIAAAMRRAEIESTWPLGRVTSRRLRADVEEPRFGGMQAISIEVRGTSGVPSAALHALFLPAEGELIVSDRLGRPIGEPIAIHESVGRARMLWGRDATRLDLATHDGLLFVRTTAGLDCYDLDSTSPSERRRWSREAFASEARQGGAGRWGGGIGSRKARDGSVPLGLRIVEPENPGSLRSPGLVAMPQGLVVPGRGSVCMLDPVTGDLLWERHRIAPGTSWIADAEYLCGCTPSGRDSVVLDPESGRLVATCDLPEGRQRLATAGRRIVAVRSVDMPPGRLTARQVRLELVDPVGCRQVSLGEFAGESRAVETSDGRLAVMAPDGSLTLLDLRDGGVIFRTELPELPRRFERLAVQTWDDRYLVLAGGPDEEGGDELSPLQPLLSGQAAMPPLSAAVWALSRTDGRPLWPAPAIVAHHDLLPLQPEEPPVLVFARLLPPDTNGPETILSLLCLDKRSGHSVAEDERLSILPHQAGGCQVEADPAGHTLLISGGRGSDRLLLTFTGEPLPPQPPYGSGSREAAPGIAGFLPPTASGGGHPSGRPAPERPR